MNSLQPSSSYQKKTIQALFSLFFKGALVHVATLFGNVYLYRHLEAKDFGVVALVKMVLVWIGFFADFGFSGYLIQKKDGPTQIELSSMNMFQFGLAAVVVSVLWTVIPAFSFFSQTEILIFRLMMLDLMLTLLKAIPTILMERNMLFGRISFLESISNYIFFGTTCLCVYLGYGVLSFGFGALVQGASTCLLAYILFPWKPSLQFNGGFVREALRYGLPYQAKNLSWLCQMSIYPFWAAPSLGKKQLGYLQWSMDTAFFPNNILNTLARVGFSLYSRLQGTAEMELAYKKMVKVSVIFCYGFLALTAGLAPTIVPLFFSKTWVPAIPILYVYLGSLTLGFYTPIFSSLMDALGKPAVVAKIMFASTCLTWALGVLGGIYYGSIGLALAASCVLVLISVAAWIVTCRLFPNMKLVRSNIKFVCIGVCVGLITYTSNPWIQESVWKLASVAALSLCAYVILIYLSDKSIIQEIRSLSQ